MMKSAGAIAIAMVVLAGAACSGGVAQRQRRPRSRRPRRRRGACHDDDVDHQRSGVTGSFTVRTFRASRPRQQRVVAFVGSAVGFNGTPRFDWTFAAPLRTQISTGPQVRPDLGCNY
jgi:hypothetical protein